MPSILLIEDDDLFREQPGTMGTLGQSHPSHGGDAEATNYRAALVFRLKPQLAMATKGSLRYHVLHEASPHQ